MVFSIPLLCIAVGAFSLSAQAQSTTPSSSSSSDVFYPIFAATASGGITTAGTYCSRSTGQVLYMNGTFSGPLPTTRSWTLPTFRYAACGSINLRGSSSGVAGYVSPTILMTTSTGYGFIDPDSNKILASAGSLIVDGSRVGVSTPAANFTVTSNVSTAILNNPAAGNSAVSAAVSFNPKGACSTSGSAPTSMVVLQNTGLLGPNDVVFPTFFTNVTCMRIKTSIVTTSTAAAKQTVVDLRAYESPPIDRFESGGGFKGAPASIKVTLDGSVSDLSKSVISVNNTLSPDRVYRVIIANTGTSTESLTMTYVVAALSAPGADCNTIDSDWSVPAGVLVKPMGGGGGTPATPAPTATATPTAATPAPGTPTPTPTGPPAPRTATPTPVPSTQGTPPTPASTTTPGGTPPSALTCRLLPTTAGCPDIGSQTG